MDRAVSFSISRGKTGFEIRDSRFEIQKSRVGIQNSRVESHVGHYPNLESCLFPSRY